MKRIIYALTFIFLLIFFFNINFKKVLAQPSMGIKISPVRIEDIVDPGETITKYIKVANESNQKKTLYVYLKDFKAEGEEGKPKLIAPGSEKGYFLASWIDITKEGIEFGPWEEKTIKFQIHVPSDVGPGGYYGAILFGAQPPKLNIEGEDKGAGMAIAQQTGCLVLLQVSGDIIEKAEIREFSTDKNFYSTPFKVNFLIRVENLGNVHVKPHGAITIKNMFGKKVAEVKVNDKGANVLPNSIRRFEVDWESDSGFGKYTAELGLSYGTAVSKGGKGKQSIFSTITFWIIPWRIIIPVTLWLIFLGSLIFLFLRLYKNKAVKKAMERAGLRYLPHTPYYAGPSPTLHLTIVLIVVLLVLLLVVGAAYLLFFA